MQSSQTRQQRHHTSVSEDTPAKIKPALAVHGEENLEVICPTVLVEINGTKVHAFIGYWGC